MWYLTALTLAASIPAHQSPFVIGGETFGPRQTLVCTWFTNFENDRLEQCWNATGKILQDGDGASIQCVRREICQRMDAKARTAAHSTKPEPPWGLYTVSLVARVGLQTHEKRYLGDSTRTVLIEKVTRVSLSTRHGLSR